MNTRTMHQSGYYPAVEPYAMPRMRGQWLARMPFVVGATVGVVTLFATTLGIIYGAA